MNTDVQTNAGMTFVTCSWWNSNSVVRELCAVARDSVVLRIDPV